MTPLRLQILVLTITRVVLNTAQRMVYPYLPVFGRGMGVDLTQLSQAVAVRSVLGAGNPFFAAFADGRSRKNGILIGLLIAAGGACLLLGWPVYPVFVLTLILTLVGKYLHEASVLAFLGERVPYERRGKVIALTEFGWSLSFIIGIPLVGLLIARFGWQVAFPAVGFLGLLCFVWLAWLLPKDSPHASMRNGMWLNLKSVLTYVPALSGLGMSLIMSIGNEIVNLVFGVWMEDSFGLKIAALGAASAVIGLSELGGEGLSAILADRWGKLRTVVIGLLLNALAALGLPLLGGSLAGALVGLFLFYITYEFTIVCSISLMSEVVTSARATMMASHSASRSLGRAVGALLAPMLYGLGFWVNCVAVLFLNLLAIAALYNLRRSVGNKG